jgi:glutaredoxin 3
MPPLAAHRRTPHATRDKEPAIPVIDIYTQPWCPYCARAVNLLTKKGAAFREIDAPHGTSERAESTRRAGGRSSVPQIFIGGRHIGGCDELMALDARGELDKLLQAG